MLRALAAILLFSITLAGSLSAQRHNTIRKGLKADRGMLTSGRVLPDELDTVAASVDSVKFAGYEKTLRSTRETVFVTNLAAREIDRLIFTVTYLDTQGRVLHKARKNLYGGIPSGETRKIDFPTWDRQFAFYYIGSPRPRVSARPYNVRIMPDTIIYKR